MDPTTSRSRYRYGTETAGLTIGNWANEAYVYNELNTDLVFGTNSAVRVRIKNDGNVGIGTDTPGAKLDVAGTIKITDGSQGAGKVLTSDANGLATWTTPAAAPSFYYLYNVYGVPSSSFQLGASGTMVTFAIYNNCTGMKAYGGTMMINPAGNVAIINYTAVDATGATMSATGNVISLVSGCGTITITLNVSGSSCTMTTGGVGGAYTEAKMTVIAM